MQLTRVLFAKPKSKVIMVLLRSTGSNHQIRCLRERTADKKEMIFFDPWVQMNCVYKEEKKLRSMKYTVNFKTDPKEHTYGIIPEELLKYDKTQKNQAKVKQPKNEKKQSKVDDK